VKWKWVAGHECLLPADVRGDQLYVLSSERQVTSRDIIEEILEGKLPAAYVASADCPPEVVAFFASPRWVEEGYAFHAVLNPCVGPESIRLLANSEVRHSRVAAASAHSVPLDVAQALAKLPDPAVVGALALNPRTPSMVLSWMLRHRPTTRIHVLGNPGLPARLLADAVENELAPAGPWRYLFTRLVDPSVEPTHKQLRDLEQQVAAQGVPTWMPNEPMRSWGDRVEQQLKRTRDR
jgi:hypothetical protein